VAKATSFFYKEIFVKKLIGWELATLAFCVVASFVSRSIGFGSPTVGFLGTAIGILFVATAVLATTNKGHIAALAAAVTTILIALIAVVSVASKTGVVAIGDIALVALFIAAVATVVASQLRTKYALTLLSMLTEGAAVFALF